MNVRERLLGSDRSQMNLAEAIANDVLRSPDVFADLFDAILDEDANVRERAADAAERVTRGRPDLLVPYRKRLIAEAGAIEEPGVQRYVAMMLPRVKLEPKERAKAIAVLERLLDSPNAAVAGSAMFSLGDFSNDDAILRERMLPRLERIIREGPAALQNRAQRVFARLNSQHTKRRPAPRGRPPRR